MRLVNTRTFRIALMTTVSLLRSDSDLMRAAPPPMPPDARRALMVPIAEEDFVVRNRLAEAVVNRKKSFIAQQSALDEFRRKLAKGALGKYYKPRARPFQGRESNSPEYVAYKRLNGALSDWQRVLRDEQEIFSFLADSRGTNEIWVTVTHFTQLSVSGARELGRILAGIREETQFVEEMRGPHPSAIVAEFARQIINADMEVLQAAQHEQATINSVLVTLGQGTPDMHLARFNTWMRGSRQGPMQYVSEEDEFARLVGVLITGVAAVTVFNALAKTDLPSAPRTDALRKNPWDEYYEVACVLGGGAYLKSPVGGIGTCSK